MFRNLQQTMKSKALSIRSGVPRNYRRYLEPRNLNLWANGFGIISNHCKLETRSDHGAFENIKWEKLSITLWPPVGETTQDMNSFWIIWLLIDIPFPRSTCAGLSNRSLVSSLPYLNAFMWEDIDFGRQTHVPTSVRVYSDNSAALCRASEGNRWYWWYHFE